VQVEKSEEYPCHHVVYAGRVLIQIVFNVQAVLIGCIRKRCRDVVGRLPDVYSSIYRCPKFVRGGDVGLDVVSKGLVFSCISLDELHLIDKFCYLCQVV